jgi:hypothetical protein
VAEQVAAENRQIWAVADGWTRQAGDLMPLPGNAANVTKILRSLGIDATITGECANEQDAKLLGDSLRGLIGIGRLTTPRERPELLRLFDGLKVEQQQRTVRVEASIAGDVVDSLLEMMPAAPQAAR